jgi:hypothetical protein
MTNSLDLARMLCLTVAGVIIFPIGNPLLYGATWSTGGGPGALVIILEAALAVAVGVVCELLFKGKSSSWSSRIANDIPLEYFPAA